MPENNVPFNGDSVDAFVALVSFKGSDDVYQLIVNSNVSINLFNTIMSLTRDNIIIKGPIKNLTIDKIS